MKIGITERGDAGIDFLWYDKILKYEVEGAVLITKNLTEEFIQKVITLHQIGFPLIIHCTCTGWGGTAIEPGVPPYQMQLQNLYRLIQAGFPAERCVLRIDPVFPTENGLKKVMQVLNTAGDIVPRIRISVLDEYKHVKQRFLEKGWQPIYGEEFQANEQQLQSVITCLLPYGQHQSLCFETCAESRLVMEAVKMGCGNLFSQTGCLSLKDLDIMQIPYDPDKLNQNPQNRSGCKCLSCKTELLERKHPCPHKCAYCYWK